MESKLSADSIKSPKFNGIRAKKLQCSPFTMPITLTPKTSREISKPLYAADSDEPTNEYICMICLEQLQPNNTSFTNCGHIFHSNCLKLWYRSRSEKSCPLCRNDDIFDAPLLPVQSQPDEEKYEDYDDYESLQQNVMTSLFQLWPISAFSTQQPKELWNMVNRSLESSQQAFKAGQILQAYRLLRRSMHLHDGIQFCENSNIFMKQYGCEYSVMETYFTALIKKFDEKLAAFFSMLTVFQAEIHFLQKHFIERCSTKFTFSF